MEVNITELCNDFLQSGNSDVLLVHLSEQFQSGPPAAAAEDAASALLHNEYKSILVKLGWDILSLLVPHVRPSYQHCWSLICKIAEVGSPKEMSLALLEQMETLSAEEKVYELFMMLKPLQKVLLRLKNDTVINSTLHSTGRLLHRHYSNIGSHDRKTNDRIMNREEGDSDDDDSDDDKENTSQDVGDRLSAREDESGSLSKGGPPVIPLSSVEESISDGLRTRDGFEENLTLYKAIMLVLEFIQPFVEDIHSRQLAEVRLNSGDSGVVTYCHDYSQNRSPSIEQLHWTRRRKLCSAILLHLLDKPLVTHNLSEKGKSADKRGREIAGSIMLHITKCHCGSVWLLRWTEMLPKQLTKADEDEEEKIPVSHTGMACYSYLLFSEGMEASYYPAVISPSTTFQLNLTHITTLLEFAEKAVIHKGLALFKSLLSRLPMHSLPTHTLEDKRYLQLAELLTKLMTTCPHRSVRQRSVPLLLKMIDIFSADGRYRFYRNLLHSVSHPGVRGLLVHNIKNEVDQSLRSVSTQGSCPFLGSKLRQLLKLTMSVSEENELLREMDRIMPTLNFLRYLLIRDKQHSNMTGVWDMVDHLHGSFVKPLRQMMIKTRAHSQHELEAVKQGEQTSGSYSSDGGDGGEPELSVEVMGEQLPDVTPDDRRRMLQLAEHQLDMMESVLVRVEELLEGRA